MPRELKAYTSQKSLLDGQSKSTWWSKLGSNTQSLSKLISNRKVNKPVQEHKEISIIESDHPDKDKSRNAAVSAYTSNIK